MSTLLQKKEVHLIITLLTCSTVVFSFFYFQKFHPRIYRTDMRSIQGNPKHVLSAKAPGRKSASPSATPTTLPTLTASRKVYLGMWTEGMWDDPARTFHPEKLLMWQEKIKKNVAIAHFYTGWENLSNPSFISQLQSVSDHGWRPMVSANPYFTSQCVSNGKTIYRAIADGSCDQLVKNIAAVLKTYGKPVFLRFAWEMNIDSMEWSIQKTGSSPDDYIQAWRRFKDIATNSGATNVIWVFSPNTITPSSIPYSFLYPGDRYVDWVALDGYNWGTTQSWSSWQSFSDVFSSSYQELVRVAPTKPMMLAEVNTTDKGGNKAEWYKDMLSVQLPTKFPQIKAVVFYNENRQAKEGVNWLIDSSQDSLVSFSLYIQNSMYLSSF